MNLWFNSAMADFSEIKPAEIAGILKITPQAVWKWRGRVPAERVLPIVLGLKGRVSPHDIRPDLYPDPGWMPDGVEMEAA